MNGAEALDKLKKEYFDLVLTDSHMPLTAGMEILESLTAQQSSDGSPLVIIMIKNCLDAVQKQAMMAGACLVLPKDDVTLSSWLPNR